MSRKDRDEMAELVERLAIERGGKVMGLKSPDVAAPVAIVVEPAPARPGDLIVEFEVNARPTPWKSPTVTKRGNVFKDAKLVKWQAEVRRCCQEAMQGRPPYEGPVELRFLFSLIRKSGSPPDLSNLVKAAEDSAQGSAIVNDRQVVAMASHRTFGDRDFARVQVLAYKSPLDL